MLKTGEILKHDIFSHTVPGKPWVAHEWLSEVFMAFCYNLAGLPGVTLVFFLMAGLTITLLFKSSQSLSNEWSAFCAVAIAMFFAQTHLLARPHIFTWLFGVLFLYVLIRNDRKLWLFPVLTAIWSNLHGGVLLGLVLQGAFLAGRILDCYFTQKIREREYFYKEFRRPFYVLLLSLITLGLNPFGYSLLLFPFQVSAQIFSLYIDEWQAPNLQQMWPVRVWLIMLVILIASQGRRIAWTWRILLVFFVYQALGHVRYLSTAAMTLAPWTAMSLQECCSGLLKKQKHHEKEAPVSTSSGPFLMIVSFVLLFTISTLNPIWWQTFTTRNFALPEKYSQGAIDYLQIHGYPGKYLLNEYSLGGFLIYSLEPPPKVFIDGRADMYGEKVFSDYATLTHLLPDFDKILAEYKIDWVLYPRDTPLIRYLENKPGWKIIYKDDMCVILSLKR